MIARANEAVTSGFIAVSRVARMASTGAPASTNARGVVAAFQMSISARFWASTEAGATGAMPRGSHGKYGEPGDRIPSFVLTPVAAPTPEPATLVLFGTAATVALSRRRRFDQR